MLPTRSILILTALTTCTGTGNRQGSATSGLDPKYRILTPELLATEPDSAVEWAVVQNVLWRIGDDYDRETEIVRDLSPGLRAVYTTWNLENEVNNGGFIQYFFNSSGLVATEALEGLRLLGADAHVQLMEQAMAVYARERPRLDTARRKGTVEAFRETYEGSGFDPLDEQFYSLPGLGSPRVRLIRSHPEFFRGP